MTTMDEDDIIVGGGESGDGFSGSHPERYPYPYYYGHTDYPVGSGFVPPPPLFQPPRPICEAGNAATVYGPANFYSGSQLGQSSDCYEIEVSFN